MIKTKSEILDGVILKDDLYKNNTLLLKKGSVLNSYILNKLNNFGIFPKEYNNGIAQLADTSKNIKEILIIQKERSFAYRTKEILRYAGFESDKIFLLNSFINLREQISKNNISYIFVDSVFYCEEFLQEVFLLKNKQKINIFVLNCEELKPQKISYNNDFFNIKFLHRPLANNYIKALLSLYS